MIIITLEKSELYPYYEIGELKSGSTFGTPVLIPTEMALRWRQVMKDFEKVQEEMEAALAEKR